MDSDTKEPDTDQRARRGKGYDSLTFQFGHHLGSPQLLLTRIGDDGSPTGEMWCLPVEARSRIERDLIAFIKEQGIYVGAGSFTAAEGAEDAAKRQYERKSLERGDMVPCEVCGTATRGVTLLGIHEATIDALREPDPAGRVWAQGDVIAVCDNQDCVNVWVDHLTSLDD